MKDQLAEGSIHFQQLKKEASGEKRAKLMVQRRVLSDNGVDVIFGLHINSKTEVGHVNYKPGGTGCVIDGD
ncbi:hypothetical protein [Okeania hirsuta]|nr:hypothetical protein [Okeania hirsuta]